MTIVNDNYFIFIMIYIFDFDDLEKEGVSAIEFNQSLQIKCFHKVFQRIIDLNKKLKIQVFNVSEELTEKGIDNIITESNYSYTIWKQVNQIV